MLEETTINVTGLQFHGYHGVTQEERTIGVQLVANISATVLLDANPKTDDLSKTVNYIELAQTLLTTSDSQSFQTLEALIASTADTVLNQFPLVASLTISIEKPAPPAPITVESVGVEMSFSRPD